MGSTLARELRDAQDYLRRAHALFIDAMAEPDHGTAEILFRIGREFLSAAEEIESAVAAQIRAAANDGVPSRH